MEEGAQGGSLRGGDTWRRRSSPPMGRANRRHSQWRTQQLLQRPCGENELDAFK